MIMSSPDDRDISPIAGDLPVAATRCLTLTVDDAPAGEDVFGSHEPIAAAVHELITTEPGGRTVGLEGSWGIREVDGR